MQTARPRSRVLLSPLPDEVLPGKEPLVYAQQDKKKLAFQDIMVTLLLGVA